MKRMKKWVMCVRWRIWIFTWTECFTEILTAVTFAVKSKYKSPKFQLADIQYYKLARQIIVWITEINLERSVVSSVSLCLFFPSLLSPALSLSDNLSNYDVISCLCPMWCPASLSSLSSLSRSTRILYLPLRWEEVTVYWSPHHGRITALMHANHANVLTVTFHFTISIIANIHSLLFKSSLFGVVYSLTVSGISLNCRLVTISIGIHTAAFPNALWSNYCDSSWDNTANNSFSLSLFFLFCSALYWTNTHRLSRRDNGHRPVLGFE